MAGRHRRHLAVAPDRHVRRRAARNLVDRHLGELAERPGLAVGEADQIRRPVAEIPDCHVMPPSYRPPTDGRYAAVVYLQGSRAIRPLGSAGDLRVDAGVVERAGQDRDGDGAGAAAVRGVLVVSALTAGNRPDDQPDDEDDRAESHDFSLSGGRAGGGAWGAQDIYPRTELETR